MGDGKLILGVLATRAGVEARSPSVPRGKRVAPLARNVPDRPGRARRRALAGDHLRAGT
jgi:hypothetical protein